jgi:hypothetical protein
VSHGDDSGYGFADGVPLRQVPPGSTLLVAGPALSGGEDLARSLVADSIGTDDGGLFILTNESCQKLLQACHRTHGSPDSTQFGVIDCSGQETGRAQHNVPVKYVSSQSDLTGISMRFSSLYESLYANANGGRIRTGLISLSSLLMSVDLETVFQFAQTLSGRIDTTGGLGVFAIDPTTHDAQTVNTFSQIADGLIEVRQTDDTGRELRVRGLQNQPDGWQPFSL